MRSLLSTAVPVRWSAALFAIATIAMLARLWGNGFTSGDEGFTATAPLRFGGVWEAAISMAQAHGRFYHLFIYPIAQLPYLFDSLAVVNLSRIASSGLVQLAYFGFVRELFGTRIALISGFLFLGLFNTVGGSYNPFHGLPFWFNFGMSLVLASYWAYARAHRLGLPHRLAYVLFFASLLTYEVMIVYAAGFVLMHFGLPSATPGDVSAHGRMRKFLRDEIGLITALCGYLALYFGFRQLFPGVYAGAKELSLGPWKDVARTIWNFSISGMYFRLPSGIDVPAWRPLLYSAGVATGLVIAWRHVPLRGGRLQAGASAVTAGVIFFAFAPNLLFGFTERYRGWDDRFYLGSYYSAFAICLALALVVERMRARGPARWRTGVLPMLLGVFALVTYANQVQSLRFYDESRRDALRWEAANALARTVRNEGWKVSRICTTTFITREDPYDYWSYYLSERIGKPVLVWVRDGGSDECDLHVYLERNSEEMKVRVARRSGDKDVTITVFRAEY